MSTADDRARFQATADSVAQARALYESLLTEAEQLRTRASELRSQIAALEASAARPEDGVRVTVDGQGALAGLDIDPRAYRRLSPGELAELILSLTRQARGEVVARARKLMDDADLRAPEVSTDQALGSPLRMEAY